MDIFVARQPIFDQHQKVVAYELLFRNGFQNCFQNTVNGDQATSTVLTNSFISIGMNELTRGKRAFINFTRNLLVDQVATIFPRDLLAVEILETIEPDQEVVNACRRLREKGYKIVLDDFVFDEKFIPLMQLADIIKVDFLLNDEQQRRRLVQQYQKLGIQFLAEKVETKEEFEKACQWGYSYFQGYFFCKPEIVTGKDIPGYKLNYLQILQEIHKPELNLNELENIIKRDVSLSFKLLKFINSAAFGIPREIKSIRQALVMLGSREIKKWVSLLVLNHMGSDKPKELTVNSLIRAHFCEEIAKKTSLQKDASDLFLMGLFSLIDAFMDRPMEEILKGLPISVDIRDALLGKQNVYRKVFEVVVNYEQGNWAQCEHLANELQLESAQISGGYLEAVEWAHQLFIPA